MPGLIVLVIWILAVVGWVMNIVKLIGFTGTIAAFGVIEILRVVGIFVAPLGAVLGYF